MSAFESNGRYLVLLKSIEPIDLIFYHLCFGLLIIFASLFFGEVIRYINRRDVKGRMYFNSIDLKRKYFSLFDSCDFLITDTMYQIAVWYLQQSCKTRSDL